MELTHAAARVLGALAEKALATPQHYPLSVNALLAACNQATNREPVTDYDEAQVRAALDELRAADLAAATYARGSRVPRYAHRLDETFDLDEAAVAVLAVLLLRGPQTVGELRARTERLHAFGGLEEVEDTLAALEAHPWERLAAPVARLPGQKETRYAHLLAGPASSPQAAPTGRAAQPAAGAGGPEAQAPGTAALQAEVERLRAEVTELRALVDQLITDRPGTP